MSDKTLLILITRITGDDEWNKLWNFPAGKFISFIHSGKPAFYSYEDFQILDLKTQLQADAWVLRGYDYTVQKRQKIHAVLNNVEWGKQKVTLKIHRGSGDLVADEGFQQHIVNSKYENAKALFKQAVDYSIGNQILDSNPIVRFARGLRKSLTPTEYQRNLRLAIAPMPLHVQVANAMHHLSYVLHPLDIDFQGLEDRDFQLECWQELAEDYKNDKVVGKLNQTRALIYGQESGADNTVETVLREANDLYDEGAWKESWKKLEKLVPQKGIPEELERIQELMKVSSEENLGLIKKHFGDKNPVHAWVTNVHQTLAEVRDALSARETVPKK